jgi:hypothetical protein
MQTHKDHFLISGKWSVITSASAHISLSDPNALIPCTSSGSTTSSWGIVFHSLEIILMGQRAWKGADCKM